ncbi:MAG: patatin family protein [Ruminococcus sp.]|nr:patatin family protein [Ruminococcus sp.]
MKYGLVMEGGAMRGLFTAGVTDVLMENGFTFDSSVGVSAGACFGCNYKSGQHGRAIRYNLRFRNEKRYCSWSSLIHTGDMFGAEFCYHTIPEKLDLFDNDTYESNPMSFFVVGTDINTGKAVYHNCRTAGGDDLEWIRASASMPLVSRIVKIGGREFLDGGISDSIPLRFMESTGCDRNIVILTQPRGYIKTQSRTLGLVKLRYGRKYPQLVRAFEERPRMYNDELRYIASAEKAGRALVIAPPEKLPIGHVEHDMDKLLEVYRIGRNAARARLAEIRAFLGQE